MKTTGISERNSLKNLEKTRWIIEKITGKAAFIHGLQNGDMQNFVFVPDMDKTEKFFIFFKNLHFCIGCVKYRML